MEETRKTDKKKRIKWGIENRKKYSKGLLMKRNEDKNKDKKKIDMKY